MRREVGSRNLGQPLDSVPGGTLEDTLSGEGRYEPSGGPGPRVLHTGLWARARHQPCLGFLICKEGACFLDCFLPSFGHPSLSTWRVWGVSSPSEPLPLRNGSLGSPPGGQR